MRDARIAVGRHGPAVIMHIEGAFRAENVAEVRADMMAAVESAAFAVIDLGGVRYIDSAGIAAIVGLSKRMSADAPGRLVLCGADARIGQLLRTMKLDRVFPMYANVRAALAAFTAEGLLDIEPQRG